MRIIIYIFKCVVQSAFTKTRLHARGNYSRGKQRSEQRDGKTAVHAVCGMALGERVISEAVLSSARLLSAFRQESAEWLLLFTTQVFFSSLITHWSTWKWSPFFCTPYLTLHCLNRNCMSLFVFKMLPGGLDINRFSVHILLTVTTVPSAAINLAQPPYICTLSASYSSVTGVQAASATQICSETNKMPPNSNDTFFVKSPLIIILACIYWPLNHVLCSRGFAYDLLNFPTS